MIERRWARDFDRHSDQALSVFDDTQPLPLYGALLAGPASELDAVPMPADRRPPPFWAPALPYLAGAGALALLQLAAGLLWWWSL
jgi:hypothetical protein